MFFVMYDNSIFLSVFSMGKKRVLAMCDKTGIILSSISLNVNMIIFFNCACR